MAAANLFKPLKVGAIELGNRLVMAPLTRCRATLPGYVPNELMAEYYGNRAGAGLVITEATQVADKTSAFYAEAGIYSDEQVEGWKLTTKAVHDKGGKIFCQIFHGGRACHSSNNGGQQCVAPSAQKVAVGHIAGNFNATHEKVDYETPRALALEELPGIVKAFVDSANNAIKAGFDGVEVHGANGYLLDEFLRQSSNERTDAYGGPLENRARLLLEVVDAVSAAIGKDRVGVRISPLNSYQAMKDEDPVGLTKYVSAELSKREIAYLHVMRGDFFQAQKGDVVTPARENFKGVLFVNMFLEIDEANEAVGKEQYDAPVFGTKWLANPDLDKRAAAGAPLNPPNAELFYTTGAKGYTDYPTLEESEKPSS